MKASCWAVVGAGAMLLAACGTSDGDEDAASPTSTPAAATEGTEDPEIDETVDGTFGDLEASVRGLEVGMGAVAEIVDSGRVRFTVEEGSKDEPFSGECIAAEAILSDEVEITIVYPDGELVC